MLTLEFLDQANSSFKSVMFNSLMQKGYELLKKKIDGMLAFSDGVVAIILIGDEEIRNINHSHRGYDKPTDVVALSYIESSAHPDEFPTGFEMAGEIFISLDTAKKQAEQKGHSLEQEVKILFTHGFLHVFGFDHQDDEQEAEMESWAKQILQNN